MLICVLGRQPGLSIAELEAAIGPDSIKSICSDCAIVNKDPADLSQRELGGVIKIAEVVFTIPSVQWGKIFAASVTEITNYMTGIAEQTGKKVALGLSTYGQFASPKKTSTLAFTIKKRLNEKGHSVNIVLGEDTDVSSASVIHSGLLGKGGAEFILVAGEKETYMAKTISVQDIESYSKRDLKRPKRDTVVGMLPPKLAQMMLNLAKVTPGSTVLDPFCGTGVVLMEAALKHAKIVGSDIEQKMIDYTKGNLEWLSKEYGVDTRKAELIRADATTHKWKNHFDCLVSETYLGPPLAYQPKEEVLNGAVKECNLIVTKFLTNLRQQLKPEIRCCIAVPAWATPEGLMHLPVIEQLDRLGYGRVKFLHTTNDQLIYRRPDQIVARELLVLTLKNR